MPLLSSLARLLLLSCAFTVFTRSAAVAAPARNTGSATPREQIEACFGTIMQGDTAKAFDTLLDGSAISASKPGASSLLRQQMDAGMRAYGKPLGFDLVDSKTYGTSLIRLVYIFKLEKYPLTFEFFFYQNGRTFLPIDVRFNDKLDVYRYDRVPTTNDATPPS